MNKKLLAVCYMLFFAVSAFAQINVNGTDLTNADNQYLEVVCVSNHINATEVNVVIDYGQNFKQEMFSERQAITDEDGKELVFVSGMHAVNYLSKRGWNYLQTTAAGTSHVMFRYTMERAKPLVSAPRGR